MKVLKKIFTLLLILSFYNCTVVKIVDTSYSSYKSEDFNKVDFKDSQIAILPILTDDSKHEGVKRRAGNILAKELNLIYLYGKTRIVSPIDVINMINSNDLTNKYSIMMKNYRETGILNKNSLNEIGSKLNSRYLLYTRLNSYVSAQTKNYDKFGNYTSVVEEIEFYSQLWDAEKGDIVWEGYGGSAQLANSSEKSKDLLSLAIKNLSKQIGNNVCKPKNIPSDVHNNAQHIKTGNVIVITVVAGLIIPILLAAAKN